MSSFNSLPKDHHGDQIAPQDKGRDGNDPYEDRADVPDIDEPEQLDSPEETSVPDSTDDLQYEEETKSPDYSAEWDDESTAQLPKTGNRHVGEANAIQPDDVGHQKEASEERGSPQVFEDRMSRVASRAIQGLTEPPGPLSDEPEDGSVTSERVMPNASQGKYIPRHQDEGGDQASEINNVITGKVDAEPETPGSLSTSIRETYDGLGGEDEVEVSLENPLFTGEVMVTFEVDSPEHDAYRADIGRRACACIEKYVPVGLPAEPVEVQLIPARYIGQTVIPAEYFGHSEGVHKTRLHVLDRNYWYGVTRDDSAPSRVIEVHEGQDEALVLGAGHEALHAAVEEYVAFREIPNDSLLATIGEGFATTGELYLIQQRLAEIGDTNPARTAVLKETAAQAFEFLRQIAEEDLPSETLADRKHYLDGVRIVTRLVEYIGGVQNISQLLRRLDSDMLAAIKQGTGQYAQIVEDPLILMKRV